MTPLAEKARACVDSVHLMLQAVPDDALDLLYKTMLHAVELGVDDHAVWSKTLCTLAKTETLACHIILLSLLGIVTQKMRRAEDAQP